MEPETDKICGVEIDIIEKVISLIQERYPAADRATYFLETQTHVQNTIGRTNIRDFLSHLSLIFGIGDQPISREKKQEQLALAEEHLRRAIIEPYERAVDIEVNKIKELHPEYMTEVAPQEPNLQLEFIMKQENIKERLREVAKLVAEGRQLKNRNIWDGDWEESVKIFIQAFEVARPLRNDLENAIAIGEHAKLVEIAKNQENYIDELKKTLNKNIYKGTIVGVFATILIGVISVILTWLLK